MTPAPVLITRRVPDPAANALRSAGHNFERLQESRNATRDELLAAVPGRTALLTMLDDKVDAELMDRAGPSLRVVANCAVGHNNIDLAEATRRRIHVCNTPGVLTEATADIAWALLMAAARRICEGDQLVRRGEFTGWAPGMLLGHDLTGRTLGIVGSGRIGSATARRSLGWKMRVLYVARRPKPTFEQEFDASPVDLATLCRESDFISVHTPLTPETLHLFSTEQFKLMKPTCVFINTARGPIHDEAALVNALSTGTIAAAGLDVYENEPRIHPGLLTLPNVVLLPHIGSATHETRNRMARMAAENIVESLAGRRPPNLVNSELFEEQIWTDKI